MKKTSSPQYLNLKLMHLFWHFIPIIYILNGDLNEELGLGKFVKNGKILSPYEKTRRNEIKREIILSDGGELAGLSWTVN